MHFPCFGTFIQKICEASLLLRVRQFFFLPSRQIAGCISSGLLGALLIRLLRTVGSLCFPELSPELSTTSDESWCVSVLTIGWVLGHKKITIEASCRRSALSLTCHPPAPG